MTLKDAISIKSYIVIDSLEDRLSHSDGYIREKAILEIRATSDREALIKKIGYLMIRANDWVPQVRIAAFAKIKELLEFIPPDSIIQTLPQVYRLQGCNRANHTPLISLIEDR